MKTQPASGTLPDKLTSGAKLLRQDGTLCTVQRTGRRDEYGSTLYRLNVQAHIHDGWKIPAHKTRQAYSRDELQAAGYVLTT